MSQSDTGQSAGNGPWRVIIFDPDPSDPRWVIATVAGPGDVRAGGLPASEAGWHAVETWVRLRTGRPVQLEAMPGAVCWRAM